MILYRLKFWVHQLLSKIFKIFSYFNFLKGLTMFNYCLEGLERHLEFYILEALIFHKSHLGRVAHGLGGGRVCISFWTAKMKCPPPLGSKL